MDEAANQRDAGAIFLHWIFTTALILGSQTTDVYTFVTDIFIYSGNWIKGKPRVSLYTYHLANLPLPYNITYSLYHPLLPLSREKIWCTRY